MQSKYERNEIENLESKLKQSTVYFWFLVTMRIISAVLFTLFLVSAYASNVSNAIPNYYIYIFLFLGMIFYLLGGGKSKFRNDGISLSRLRKSIKSIKNDIKRLDDFASNNDYSK